MSKTETSIDAKAFSDNSIIRAGDFNFNFGDNAASSLIQSIAMNCNPKKYAQKTEEARMVHVEGIINAMKKAHEAFPTLTESQLFFFVQGFNMTASQADSLVDILSVTRKLLDEREAELKQPDESKAAKLIEEAKNSEDWARDHWAALIAGELESPGAFSKRTITILSDMGRHEALAFERVCSLKVNFELADGSISNMPFILTGNDAVSCGAIEADDITTLISLGLLQEVRPIRFEAPYKKASFGGHDYILEKSSDGTVMPLNLTDKVFSPYGSELASITTTEAYCGLFELVKSGLHSRGINILELGAR